jgi:hypothetical protein
LSTLVAGCGSKKIVGTLKPQHPGQVTYSNDDGNPVYLRTGSAQEPIIVPIRQKFDRQPHFTYIVFRDKQRNEDHIVTMEAAGDITVSQGAVEMKDESSLLRIVEVKPMQPPVSVSLKVAPVELIDLSSTELEPRIIITSDGKVRLKFPSRWHLDDVFGLDEVRFIKHIMGVIGSDTIRFVLADKEIDVEFAFRATTKQHLAEMERVVKPMAPHVQFVSDRHWSGIAIIVLIIIIVFLFYALIIATGLSWKSNA